jgi:hypothetical protein
MPNQDDYEQNAGHAVPPAGARRYGIVALAERWPVLLTN